MVKNHMKRISMPRTWKLDRKDIKWISRPNAGAHGLMKGMALETIMKELIKCANTRKEAKTILYNKEVMVDGKRRRDLKLPVGLMDVVSLPEVDEHYRIIINKRSEIDTVKINKNEAGVKPCKIKNKTILKGGATQLNLAGSRNMIFKKGEKVPYAVGDTVMLSLPKQEIKDHIKFEKGSKAYLTGGKYVGYTGVIESIENDIIRIKNDEGKTLETNKRHAYVIGKDKPVVTISAK
ncbi:30S ribosomal protein S4e [Candidatus Woesearchaeota archaeon]|nr:30S ribosomal protein S4e [Candidatus Woesearchaeota archaeon]